MLGKVAAGLGKVAAALFPLSFGVCAAFGQQFDAASVRLSGPQSVRGSSGGPGSHDPERYTFGKAVLRDLVFQAFGLTYYREQVDGPGWIDTENYDVAVKIPPGATREQFRQMLQGLLAERFKLAVHHESVVLPVYRLVVAKGGPRLKESAPAEPGATPALGPPEHDRDGFPVIPPGRSGLWATYSGFKSKWRAQQQGMEAFAKMLGAPNNAGRIVIDKTGLTGKHDFTFFFDIPRPGASAADVAGDPTLSIFDALEQQLGLKLVDAKQSFDKIVIDHAERVPAEN